MPDGYLAALDIGTSSVRALLFDSEARQVPGVEVHLPYQPRVARDGTYETDPGRLLGLVSSAVDGLLHEAGLRRRKRIRAIGISTFWHGLLAADESGRPLTPLYLWADTRSWRQSDDLRTRVDPQAVLQRTGCLIHPTYWPAKLLWLKATQPDLWRRRPRWLSFWDLVHQRLFGSPLTGVSMASGTGLLDLVDSHWDAALLALLEVGEEQLPPIGEAGQGLVHQYRVRWPDLNGVPWVCAAGDGALANLGSGCVDPTQRALTVGTSGALRVLYRGLPERVPDGLWCYRLDRERVVVGGALSNGGNLYAWLTRTLAVDPAALEARLRRMKPAATGLTFVPLLAGERSPGFASHATGSLAGLTQATTPTDIVRSGLEATAIEFRRVDQRLDDVLPGARRLVGNGAGLLASPAWMQIMADAIGKPVAESRAKEASSRGAAILAAEFIGALDGDRLKTEVGRTYRTNPAAHDAYTIQTARQEELYRLLIRERALDAILKEPTGNWRRAMSKAANPLRELHEQGQSLWYDNIRRQLITSGELARLRDEGVTGVTSNPTIFEKAVSGSTDYDEGLVRLVKAKRKPGDILWDLMVEDIQAAADVFRPVYDQSRGHDGFVSIEVSPAVARSTRRTVDMARDLWKRCGRPNVMVKIPATRPGLPAIRQMIGEGVNINVTLIFSVDRYAEVAEAFLAGLEDLRRKGGDLSRVNSVASFFVSRVDSKIDKLLTEMIARTRDPKEAKKLERLFGKAGIANSKMAYQKFKELHSGARWEELRRVGATPQRCLWASTSVKDPRYADTMYVEELIGPDTVDTVPPNTLAAFREHGEVRRSLDEHVDVARRQLRELAEAGIDIDEVTRELEVEGVDSFFKSYEDLNRALTNAAREIRAGKGPTQWHSLGTLQPVVDQATAELQKADAPRRLWAKDGTLWKGDAADWLGWLNAVEKMESKESELRELARAGKAYSDVVLLGMGGSSLGPDVLLNTFARVPGHPRLQVLDTTDPATVAALTKSIDLPATLFIVASKSGGTTETLSQFAHFWELVGKESRKPGDQFAAITDPGTSLEKLARERRFRWVFAGQPDIGGRYSVLSHFGMVPAALAGYDVGAILDAAASMAHASAADVPAEKNPGVWLGAVLGSLARDRKRDKLTLVLSPKIGSFGYWVEQLIAESTGKEGRGIVPIEGEPLGRPADYGDDRVFVHVRMAADAEHAGVRALEAAGQPVVTLTLRDKADIGGEFLRWEIATAIGGSLLNINAFDQPNVQESKDNTRKVLAEFIASRKLPAAETLPAEASGAELEKLLGKLKASRSYFAIMSYTARTATSERSLARIRVAVRDFHKVATTSGYGPRFLHSTGQLHKGGPPVGVFLQIVQEDGTDVAIPGQPYGFSTLKQAQAIGDLESLKSRRLPVLRVSLGRNHSRGWAALAAAVESVTGKQ